MIKFPVYNLKGEKAKEIELSEKIFGLKLNNALLHQVYVSQYANQRKVIAHTKDRAERAGSGKKPWKQKGTGRARVGSVRTPNWRKGGVVFGPTKDRNFKKDVPKEMNRRALLIALSAKVGAKNLIIVENLKFEEIKTKLIYKALKDLKLNGSILVGFSKDEKKTKRAVNNLPKVDGIDIENLNVFEMLNHKFFLASESAIKVLNKKYDK